MAYGKISSDVYARVIRDTMKNDTRVGYRLPTLVRAEYRLDAFRIHVEPAQKQLLSRRSARSRARA